MGRKYRQPGYQDRSPEREESRRQEPKTEREGPRSPRMPGFHKLMRCAMCGAPLPATLLEEITFSTRCPKCGTDVHTCKNCVYFDPASRFECTQPIAQRIPKKDQRNECEFFQARTTVEKVTTSGTQKPSGAREAFENLFKK